MSAYLHNGRLAERRRRRISIDRSVPMNGGEKVNRVELGLCLLEMVAKPGVALCQEDIAIWCGCSRGGIYQIERRALKKVRTILRFGSANRVWKELRA